MSPLLFLIVMEGLSMLIGTAKREGGLKGLKMNEHCHLTHLLFVDDVMIFLDGNIRDSTSFHDILILFEKAIVMVANQSKSTITLSHTSPQGDRLALHFFHYQLHNISDGLKYLGFRIKPHSYQIAG